jgi:carbon starvation protein
MNSLFVGAVAVILLAWGYRTYGRWIERLWDVDPRRKTPAHAMRDGVDYMPAKNWFILFGHHFSSIAGAGPIIGPVVAAALWGWGPALAWIVLGSVFVGAVHDFSALMASLRHQGKSIAQVAETVMGRRARVLLASFLWLSLVLVVAVFAAVTAKTLVEEPRIVVPTFGLIPVAVLMGLMLYRWKVSTLVSTVAGLVLLAGLLFLGYAFPIAWGSLKGWILILLVYAFVASVAPVNILLQPRDYLSTFILFFGLALGYAGLFLSHPPMSAPAFVSLRSGQGSLWPMLFVIIACGAVSGFHSLIASGTTSKQLGNERDARRVGFGAMILEGVLAVLALLAVTAGLRWSPDQPGSAPLYPELLQGGNWIGTFGAGYGQLVAPILGSALGTLVAITTLNAFVMTTLDTATRIARYITEELFGEAWGLRIFRNHLVSTSAVIALAAYLALGNWAAIWPIFGASNQLVGALALMVISTYLLARRKPTGYTLYPALFMLVTTLGALIWQIGVFLAKGNHLLSAIGIILVVLALFLVAENVRMLSGRRRAH